MNLYLYLLCNDRDKVSLKKVVEEVYQVGDYYEKKNKEPFYTPWDNILKMEAINKAYDKTYYFYPTNDFYSSLDVSCCAYLLEDDEDKALCLIKDKIRENMSSYIRIVSSFQNTIDNIDKMISDKTQRYF